MSKDHSVTVQSVHAQQNWNSSQLDMYCCSIHEEQYKYFCTNHSELCCSDCAIKDHRKCEKLLLIKDLSKSSKEGKDNRQIYEKLDAVKNMFITLLESRTKDLKSIEQQKIEITKSVRDWTAAIKEIVDRLQTAALDELNQLCKQETVTISDQIVECKSAIAAIETTEEMLMGSRKSEDDTKLFITTAKVSCQVLKYLERYKTMENDTEIVELECHLDSTCKGIIPTLSSIGKLIRRVVKVPKLCADSSFATTKMRLIRPNSMVYFSAKIHNDQEMCDIYSGVFLPDERLVLFDCENERLKLFSRHFRLISRLKMAGIHWCLCRVDESTVAVTVDTDIKLVSVTNKLTLLRSISVSKLCYGIASYQQNIIVSIDGDSFLTYDTSDKIINRTESCDSLGIDNNHCVSQDGQRIYYTTKNAVVTMDMKGNIVNKFESNDLKGASGITVDKQGIIYCFGYESKTVIQLTTEGKQLGVLLSTDDGLEELQGFCLNDSNDTIVVFESKSNDVKVFKMI